MSVRIRVAAGAIVAGILYLGFHLNGWVCLIAGGIVMVWRFSPAANKAIFVMDLDTGEMKGQPMDSAAKEYLRKKGQ